MLIRHDTSIRITQGRTLTSKSFLNAGFRYSRDGILLTDGRQAWRCVKRSYLHLEPEDCRTLRQADMLLYDNASDQRRVIILATSDNLNILAESSSWYLQVLPPPLLILSHR
ncbi:hypothetical protein ACHWQZ_G017008 [Mnemiopsis leidyi]